MNSNQKGFLLVQSPCSIKTAIEIFVNRLTVLTPEDEKKRIFIITQYPYSYDFSNRNKNEVQYYIFTYAGITESVYNTIIHSKKLYCFFESSIDLESLICPEQHTYLILGSEFVTARELYSTIDYLEPKMRNASALQKMQQFSRVGKQLTPQHSTKIPDVLLSSQSIQFTEELYLDYLDRITTSDDYTPYHMVQLCNETVPRLVSPYMFSKNIHKYSPKMAFIMNYCYSGKHVVFTRFKRMAKMMYDTLILLGRKCALYSDEFISSSNYDNWLYWLNSAHSILIVSVSNHSDFWIRNLGHLQSFILLESYDDELLRISFQNVVTDKKEARALNYRSDQILLRTILDNVLKNNKPIELITLCYRSPSGDELIEDEFYMKTQKRIELEHCAVILLKNGFEDEDYESCNELFGKTDILKSDYQRIFAKGLDILN